jgi:hypothetical protein
LKFDKFLKENDAKRARAIKKTAEEREMCRIKGMGNSFLLKVFLSKVLTHFLDKEIVKLETQLEELLSRRGLLNTKLDKHEIFATFMEKVLDSSEEFSEVREIIDRYNTLVATHLDLLDREQNNQVCFEFFLIS